MSNFWQNKVAGQAGINPVQQAAQAYNGHQNAPERVTQFEAQTQQEAERAQFMEAAGNWIMQLVTARFAAKKPANVSEVEEEFRRAFPHASATTFREVVEALKAAGRIYEMPGEPGFMGQRTGARLYPLS